MAQTGQKNNKWILYTILFMIIIIILFGIILWRPDIGTFLTILLFLSLFVGSILKAYYGSARNEDSSDQNYIKKLSEEQTLNSQKLLRFATAGLAFLSLLTTASGMRSFVFDTSWKAYIASFAVQSILVVFSLLLCRFFVQITVLNWQIYVKIVANSLMVIFFCIALIVSSVFSFTYIANNAYKDSWANDREIMIQSYLLNEAYQLREENDNRGEIIINKIESTAEESLSAAFESNNDNEIEEVKTKINDKIRNLDYEKQEEGMVRIDRDAWKAAYPQYETDIDWLCSQYEDSFEKDFESAVKKYNDIIDTIGGWKENINYITISENINTIMINIKNAKSELGIWSNSENNLDSRQGIDGWKTYKVNEDASVYRAEYKSECSSLIEKFKVLETDITAIQESVDRLNTLSSIGNENELDEIIGDIYLLDVNGQDTLERIMERINNLAIAVSEDGELDSSEIRDIITLKDYLLEYQKYLILKENLDTYCNINMSKTYQIGERKNKERLQSDQKVDVNDENIGGEENNELIISEEEWTEIRKNDFNLFYSYIKMLPYVESQDIDAEEQKELYDMEAIIKDASVYQRNLLGQLTDFEKAFIYFKYDFPMMAFFSAFIAVFFDLGAFFTGCFLYATEYFDIDRVEEK